MKYNRKLFRATRIAIATVLAVAVAALPVVLDRCAEQCEDHANTTASTPACHHTTSNATHVSQVPSSCGHDHTGTVVTAAKTAAPSGRALDFIAMLHGRVIGALPALADLSVQPHAPPEPSPPLARRSLPLRV
jgi:hypothetical protein